MYSHFMVLLNYVDSQNYSVQYSGDANTVEAGIPNAFRIPMVAF